MRKAYINKEAHPTSLDPSLKTIQRDSRLSPWNVVVSMTLYSSKMGYVVAMNDQWYVQGFFRNFDDAKEEYTRRLDELTKTWDAKELMEALDGQQTTWAS